MRLVSALRRATVPGLVAGLAAVHASAIGMVESFAARGLLADLLSLGIFILLAAGCAAGYRATSPRRRHEHDAGRWPSLASGAFAGGIVGVAVAAFALFVEAAAPRAVLPNATPGLVTILRFGQGPEAGSLVGVSVLIAAGLAGAALQIIPARGRKMIVTGGAVTLVVALTERFTSEIAANLGLSAFTTLLLDRRGLTLPGAVLTFALAASLASGWRPPSRSPRRPPQHGRQDVRYGVILLLAAVALVLPHIIGSFLSETLVHVGTFVLLGLGLNIVVGYAGLLDLGYVAFYAIGAYVVALLTSTASVLAVNGGVLDFWAALPVVIVVAAGAGLLIGAPVLRLRGDYLAIVTLGLGEIARLVLLSDWLKPYLGGAQGILSIPAPEVLEASLRQPQQLYYVVLAFCGIAAVAALGLANSRVGRAWMAMREDELAAEASGIDTHRFKLLAFALGATFGCLAGAVFAVRIGSVFPHSFDILVSINALALIVLGGMGSIRGVIVGAVVLVGLPELLREFADYRLLLYGAILIGMMILRPEGLLPNRQRRAELHEKEDDEEQYGSDAGEETGRPVIATGGAR